MKNKGFTLIELLVVIAVLGILATLIIASLSKARNEAKDVAVLEEIQGMKTSVEVETGASGNYSNICNLFSTGEKLAMVRESIESKGATWVSCDSDATSYAVVIQLIPQVASLDFLDTKFAYAKEDQNNIKDVKDVKEFTGVHSNTNTVLLSNDAIQRIKKETGRSFSKPRYYCLGALPGDVKGGYREGYLYELPTGGCGNYPAQGDEMSVYGGGQQFDPKTDFMAKYETCKASYSEVEAAVSNEWVGEGALQDYTKRCPGNGEPTSNSYSDPKDETAKATFFKNFDGCNLSKEDLAQGTKNSWITSYDVEKYNRACSATKAK